MRNKVRKKEYNSHTSNMWQDVKSIFSAQDLKEEKPHNETISYKYVWKEIFFYVVQQVSDAY